MKAILSSFILIMGVVPSAQALPEDQVCQKKASRLVRQYLKIVDLQLGFRVERIQLENFRNTTPGTYNQEYEGTFMLASAEQNPEEQQWAKITFGSPMICDNLKIQRVDLTQ